MLLLVGVVSAAMAAVIFMAPLFPVPATETRFRLAYYLTHALWFVLLVTVGIVVARRWHVPRRSLVVAFLVALGLAVLGIAADLHLLADVSKAWFGAIAGVAFVRNVERPWWLLPIALCVPIADAWSVYSSSGVTNAVLERAQEEPRWIEWPTVATPIAGLPYESFGRLGIVDVLFSALFLGAAVRWGLGVRRLAVALVIGLVATSVVVLEVEGVAIPALPLICLAFLAACLPALVRDVRAAARGEAPGQVLPLAERRDPPVA